MHKKIYDHVIDLKSILLIYIDYIYLFIFIALFVVLIGRILFCYFQVFFEQFGIESLIIKFHIQILIFVQKVIIILYLYCIYIATDCHFFVADFEMKISIF